MVERCVRDAEAAGSNPVASTKNPCSSEQGFFIQADRLGISSRDSVYIIAASCGVYHHTVGVYAYIGLMRYSQKLQEKVLGVLIILYKKVCLLAHLYSYQLHQLKIKFLNFFNACFSGVTGAASIIKSRL